MKIVSVIPYSKGIHKETLTYFSSKDIPVGSIVTVPVRKKLVTAFVTESKDLLKAKSDVKSSSFNLKKVDSIVGPSLFNQEFFYTVRDLKKYYATHSSLLFSSLIPTLFLKKYAQLTLPHIASEKSTSSIRQEKLLFQSPDEERLSYYKTYIRESFAKGESLFICLPNSNDIQTFLPIISKGIEQYVFVLHGALTDKKQIEVYNKLIDETHPVVIIATGSYLFVPRNDIGTIIVERESSSTYKTFTRPYIDMRIVAEIYSHYLNAKLIYADTYLRTETLWRHDQNEFSEVDQFNFRPPIQLKHPIIDVRKNIKDEPQKKSKKFSALNDEVLQLIHTALKENRKIFLFVLRKGLAGITVCNDCGTAVLCESCSVPMTLFNQKNKITHKGKKESIFICNKCRAVKRTNVICKECDSWNLVSLGIGIESVLKEVKNEFSDAKVFVIEGETVKTKTQGKKIISEFNSSTNGILVGTEMALSYINEKVDESVVVSFDSLFSIPGFRINERVLKLLTSLSSISKNSVRIQTKNPDESILTHIQERTMVDFFREELKLRKQFNYPPFSTLIKISFSGNTKDVEKAHDMFHTLFNSYPLELFRSVITKGKRLHAIHAILRIDRSTWALPSRGTKGELDTLLLEKLISLPPSYIVHIDPEDLL
ncbi:hypothetical protein COB64_01770 [Candidatus Wolfebacteria bacterium]|nr:MAG: hypothetical protein COB64_01770 [Candidatus Wolfebacteria bacterium]